MISRLAGFKRRAMAAAAGAALVMGASSAMAAPPSTSLIEGLMTSAGGGAAADGTYDVTFSVYEAGSGGNAVWSEGPVKVAVKGGQFSYALGTTKTIDITKLGALKSQWLGVKIGADPELARVKLHATLFALHAGAADKLTCTGCVTADQVANGSLSAAKLGFNYAGSKTKGGPASDLACTGCVGVDELKFDKDVDLGKQSLKATNITAAGTVMAQEFVGDGSKLTGLKTPAGECKTAGEVVKGINADGSLKCVKAMDPTALPKDGIDEISNGLIANQFTDEIPATATGNKVAIPDNQGTDAVWNLTFPNIGTAQEIDINVKVENTDLSTVSIYLLPPDDKKTGWVLCDPCGQKDAKKYDATFNPKNAPKEQKGAGKKIADWIGANPQGLWTLKVKDTSFCVPQAPGNAAYCDTTNAKDGWISYFSIKLKTLSNQKVAQNGDVYISGTLWGKDQGHGKPGSTLKIGSGVKLGADATCDAGNKGAIRDWNGHVQRCDGYVWTKLNGALYRYATWHSYGQWNGNWFGDNRRELFGGEYPSHWGDSNGRAYEMSSDANYMRTLFQTSRATIASHSPNAMVHARTWYMYSSTDSEHAAAYFRIYNSTDKNVSWPVYWYATSYGGWGERASITVNGANTWDGSGNYHSSQQHATTLTIPPKKISTVIFIAGSTPTSGYFRTCFLAFYNNMLNLPSGLHFVDDLDWKANGWTTDPIK